MRKRKERKGKRKKKRKKKRKGKVVGKEDLVSRRLGLEVSACVNNRVETTIGRRRGGAERVFERCSPRDSIDQLAAASVEDRTTIVDDRRAEFLRVFFFTVAIVASATVSVPQFGYQTPPSTRISDDARGSTTRPWLWSTRPSKERHPVNVSKRPPPRLLH